MHTSAQPPLRNEVGKQVGFDRELSAEPFEIGLVEYVQAAVDDGGARSQSTRDDGGDSPGDVDCEMFVTVGHWHPARRNGGTVARCDDEVKPVEVEPGIAVHQQEAIMKLAESIANGPTGSERLAFDDNLKLHPGRQARPAGSGIGQHHRGSMAGQ